MRRSQPLADSDTPHLPLLGYVRRRNLPTAGELRLDRAGVIRQVLQALVSMGVVTRYDKGTDPVYQVAENQQLVAAFYRNNIIHFLINRAVTELVVQAAAEEHYGDPAADGWQEAFRLRDLLKFEFFFSGKRPTATRSDLNSPSSMSSGPSGCARRTSRPGCWSRPGRTWPTASWSPIWRPTSSWPGSPPAGPGSR